MNDKFFKKFLVFKKINFLNSKRGMFFSLTVALLLIFLLVFLHNRAKIVEKDTEFRINRAQILVMDHFVRDFDGYYIEQILTTAAKPALVKMTRNAVPFTEAQIEDIMNDGQDDVTGVTIDSFLTAEENYEQSLGTLVFVIADQNRDFQFELLSVNQYSYDTIQLNFNASYKFDVFNMNWSKPTKEVNITLPVYSMWHPFHGRTIKEDWVQNSTADQCYCEEIFVNCGYCPKQFNIMPP